MEGCTEHCLVMSKSHALAPSFSPYNFVNKCDNVHHEILLPD